MTVFLQADFLEKTLDKITVNQLREISKERGLELKRKQKSSYIKSILLDESLTLNSRLLFKTLQVIVACATFQVVM